MPSEPTGKTGGDLGLVDRLFKLACEELLADFNAATERQIISSAVKQFTRDQLERDQLNLNVLEQRNLVAALSDRLWSKHSEAVVAIETSIAENAKPVVNSDPAQGFQDALPSATQILEEGVTVFGVDAEAPVEVKAEFERPENFPTTSLEDESDEDFAEPNVPLAEPEVQVAPVLKPEPEPEPEEDSSNILKLEAVVEAQAPRAASQIDKIKEKIQPLLLERIDISAAVAMDRLDLARDISDIVTDILVEERIQLNQREQRELIERLMHDMLGLGPLEPLLADESITDIMVNGPKQVYVEQKGKLVLSDCQFRDNAHVLSIASRIVSHVGRRVDRSWMRVWPMVVALILLFRRLPLTVPVFLFVNLRSRKLHWIRWSVRAIYLLVLQRYYGSQAGVD